VVDPRDARYALTVAANRFLFVTLPLRDPDSPSALAAFIDSASKIPVSAADRHALLITVLGVLNPHTGGRLPTLVERYLSQSAGRVGQLDVFVKCIEDVIRYRGIGDRTIELAIKLIESRFGESTFNPGTIAETVGLEGYTFSRRFKHQTGLTPSEYLRNARLDRAAIRLTNSEDSVKEVWTGVGYNDAANFGHDFHEKFGVSPTMYRSLSRTQDMPEMVASSSDQRSAKPGLDGQATVLLVDDDQVLCDTTRRLLRRSGFSVLTASDGKSGLAHASSGTVDVVLLDYRLPDLDGIEFLRTLRSEYPGPKPAVAVFTADWAAEDHAAEIVNLNAGLLFKLCDFDTLARLVRSYCDLPVKVA